MNYKLIENGVLRIDDGAHIPDDIANRDWREYQDWIAEGNTPEPADPEPQAGPAPLTAEELRDMLEDAGTPMGPRPRPKP